MSDRYITNDEAARRVEMKARLISIAAWATQRAEGLHDSATTLTMLKKKVIDADDRVIKAGRRTFEQEA